METGFCPGPRLPLRGAGLSAGGREHSRLRRAGIAETEHVYLASPSRSGSDIPAFTYSSSVRGGLAVQMLSHLFRLLIEWEVEYSHFPDEKKESQEMW